MTRNNKEVISVTLDPDLIEKVDKLRERESRSSFINRTLRKALGMSEP